MVTAVTNFVNLFNHLGLSMATVQRAEITHAQVSALFWVNLGLSVVLAGITTVLAPVLAWFYGEPRLVGITLALAAAFVFGGLTVQHQALLRRRMEFRALAIINIVAAMTMAVVGISAALCGMGYWSLVCMYIALPAAQAVGVWVACRWRPGGFAWHTGVGSMLAFGGHVTGYNLVNYFSRNLDNVLIGWRWGAAPLGLYSRAYTLLLLPIKQVSPPIAAIAIPAMSRLYTDPPRYRNY